MMVGSRHYVYKMAAWPAVLLLLSVLLLLAEITFSENILGEEDGEFDFDGLPGAQHEFKIEIAAGGDQCFYQKIKKGSELHMSFEVLRGADRNVDCIIKDPNGQVIESHQWKNEGQSERNIEIDGVYEFCIDNSFSRFSTKLVYFYLVTYSVQDWEKYAKDVEKLEMHIGNFSASIQKVDKSINKMLRYQAGSRKHLITDWYLVIGNNSFIQYWSILACVVIACTSGFQAYFVRRLFTTKNVTPTDKPRA